MRAAKTSKKSKNKKTQTKQVSSINKPDGITVEQWQILLRRQAAEKEIFSTTEQPDGTYTVGNYASRHTYEVVRISYGIGRRHIKTAWLPQKIIKPLYVVKDGDYKLDIGTNTQIITLIAFATNSHQKFCLNEYLNIKRRASPSIITLQRAAAI